MIRVKLTGLLALGLILTGCPENSARGNDREAELSPPKPGAEISTVGAAIDGVANVLLVPQAMTDADLEKLAPGGVRCLFRFTTVGLPVLAYGSSAVLKLNGTLAALPAAGDGRYAADNVTVTVRPLDQEAVNGEAFATEFVLRLPEASGELGYHGFSVCGPPDDG